MADIFCIHRKHVLVAGRESIASSRLHTASVAPIVWQQLLNGEDDIFPNHNGGVAIIVVELVDEFTAAATGRQDPSVPVDRDHFEDLVFAGGNHRGRRRMFGAKANRTININTDADVNFAAGTQQRGTDAAGFCRCGKLTRVEDGFGLLV